MYWWFVVELLQSSFEEEEEILDFSLARAKRVNEE